MRSLLLQLTVALSSPHFVHTHSGSFSHLITGPRVTNSTDYSAGLFGAYPHQKYRSLDSESPILNVLKWDKQCEKWYTLIGPRKRSVPHPGPMILDAKGNLIWTGKKFGSSDNVQVQEYRGEKFLTFWSGLDKSHFWPGYYYMVDSSYSIRHVVKPVGVDYGDKHEFRVTSEGTALVIVSKVILHGEDDWGPRWLRDSVFQEIDIATGKLLFEWHASKHMSIFETYKDISNVGTNPNYPYEWFHINSIDKDSHGNYLISSRYLCTVAYIDGRDGRVVWRLGGKNSDFKDLSQGAASNFYFQHHAVLRGHHAPLSSASHNESKVVRISLFDNGTPGNRHPRAEESRGMLIDLDMSKMTAKLTGLYVNPTKQLSQSQGSVEILPGSNNILVGWGMSPAWTEYAPNGDVLCDVHFGAFAFWYLAFVQSYRVYKVKEEDWIGRPLTKPDIAVAENDSGEEQVYASWNGATHVKTWRLQGSNRHIRGYPDEVPWTNLQELPKDGFEVAFTIGSGENGGHHKFFERRQSSQDVSNSQYFRVQALGRKGRVLASSLVADRHTRLIVDPRSYNFEWVLSDAQIVPLVLLCMSSSAAYLFWCILRSKTELRTFIYRNCLRPKLGSDR